jgi:hypothetical protein
VGGGFFWRITAMGIGDGLAILQSWGPVLGPAILVLIFFLWKDWRREVRLLDRVEALEKEQKEVLLPLVSQCATAIAQNTLIMQQLEKIMRRCTAVTKRDQRSVLDQLIEDANESA